MMQENPNEDGVLTPQGFHVALAGGITEIDENMMAHEEATLQYRSSIDILAYPVDDDALERDPMALETSRHATMLENQLDCAAAELKRLTRPATVDDLLPVVELQRQVILTVRPLLDSEREKWKKTREYCQKSRKEYEDIREKAETIREQCEEMRGKCEHTREKYVNAYEDCDKLQEQANILLEQEDEASRDMYEAIRGKTGQIEQTLEDVFSEISRMMLVIEDVSVQVHNLEQMTEDNLRQLRLFEAKVDGILQ